MSILIIGGTGLLGREVLKQAVKQRYNVKCLVRNSQRSYWCLKQWGVSFLYGDLAYPSTLPEAISPKSFLDYRSLDDHRSRNLSSDVIDDLQLDKFYEEVLIYNEIDYKQKTTDTINTIIDCATLKATIKSDSVNLLEIVDWKGKLALLVTCSIIQLKKLIFFSILDPHHESHTHQSFKPSLKSLKYLMEDLIQSSNFNYTIFKLYSFFERVFEKSIKDLALNQFLIHKRLRQSLLSINESFTYQYNSSLWSLCKKEVSYLVINSLTNPSYDKKLIKVMGLRKSQQIKNVSYRAAYLSNWCVWFLTSMCYKNSIFQNLKNIDEEVAHHEIYPSLKYLQDNILWSNTYYYFYNELVHFFTNIGFKSEGFGMECFHFSKFNLYFQNRALLEENFVNFFYKIYFEFERIFLTAMLKR